MNMVTALVLDTAAILVISSICLSLRRCWYWWKHIQYSRDVFTGDVAVTLAAGSFAIVTTTILPAVEDSCFSLGQQQVFSTFRILPALLIAIGVLGVLFSRDLHGGKVSVSMLMVGILVMSVIRTIEKVEPCVREEVSLSLDFAFLDFQTMLWTIPSGISLAAAIITIVEWIYKRVRERKQKSNRVQNLP